MTRLVVIAGGYQSGKMPLACKLMDADPGLALVHRDDIRRMIRQPSVAEGLITWMMYDMARRLLGEGHSVIVVAWNLEPEDHAMWSGLSETMGVAMEWLDVRKPEVAAMIPPMQEAA